MLSEASNNIEIITGKIEQHFWGFFHKPRQIRKCHFFNFWTILFSQSILSFIPYPPPPPRFKAIVAWDINLWSSELDYQYLPQSPSTDPSLHNRGSSPSIDDRSDDRGGTGTRDGWSIIPSIDGWSLISQYSLVYLTDERSSIPRKRTSTLGALIKLWIVDNTHMNMDCIKGSVLEHPLEACEILKLVEQMILVLIPAIRDLSIDRQWWTQLFSRWYSSTIVKKNERERAVRRIGMRTYYVYKRL